MIQHINDKWIKEGIKTGKSIRRMAREATVSPATIARRVKALGYDIEPSQPEHCHLSPELKDFLYGLLLGSGCLVSRHPKTAYYSQGSQYLEYLKWISSQLQEIGVSPKGNIVPMRNRRISARTPKELIWRYSSRVYFEFKSIHDSWYRGGKKKRLPENMKLNKTIALLWYLRGGNLRRYVRRRRPTWVIRFSIRRYSPEGRELLVSLLDSIGCSSELVEDERHSTIVIPYPDSLDFLDYIGSCPPRLQDTLGHKWPRIN